jgi:hypothetical protein
MKEDVRIPEIEDPTTKSDASTSPSWNCINTTSIKIGFRV